MKSEPDSGDKEPKFITCDSCYHILISRYTCAAFPNGIPDEILKGKIIHSKPLPGQGNEIVFGLKNNLILPVI